MPSNPALGDLDLSRNMVLSVGGHRWVVTAAAAPTVGNFHQGDLCTTKTGNVYVCSVSGNPGTWVGPK